MQDEPAEGPVLKAQRTAGGAGVVAAADAASPREPLVVEVRPSPFTCLRRPRSARYMCTAAW